MAASMAVICGAQEALDVELTIKVRFCESIDIHTVEVSHDGARCLVWTVHQQWQSVSSDFWQQVLNPHFVKLLLEHKPDFVFFDEVCGASLDLINLTKIFGVRAFIGSSQVHDRYLSDSNDRARAWIDAVLRGTESAELLKAGELASSTTSDRSLTSNEIDRENDNFYDRYAGYALGHRSHGLLFDMQAPHVSFFKGCSRVLDIGCGTGIFLDALDRVGLKAEGVERNPLSAEYARNLGHKVHSDDAIAFVSKLTDYYDGIYCSHFVEHLPIEVLDQLVQGISRALISGGVAVFVFPDPESIRSQLLGFWRDPEHVRFYHPELIELMCSMEKLKLVKNSQLAPGRNVFSFSMGPPHFNSESLLPDTLRVADGCSWYERLLNRFGLASLRQLGRVVEEHERSLIKMNGALERRFFSLEGATKKLWEVNQTWAWDDNAVMVFRKI